MGRETRVQAPYCWPQDTDSPPFAASHPRIQGETQAGRGQDTRRRFQQVAAVSGRAPRAGSPRARIMDVELSYFVLLALEFETPDEDQDS